MKKLISFVLGLSLLFSSLGSAYAAAGNVSVTSYTSHGKSSTALSLYAKNSNTKQSRTVCFDAYKDGKLIGKNECYGISKGKQITIKKTLTKGKWRFKYTSREEKKSDYTPTFTVK